MKNKIIIAGVTASIWSMIMVAIIGRRVKRKYYGVGRQYNDNSRQRIS